MKSGLCALAGLVLAAALAKAQTNLTATTDHVGGAPDSIRIDVLRWSTDAERDALLSAWTHPGAPRPGGRAARGPVFDPFGAGNDDAVRASLARGAGRGGRGGGRGGDPSAAETARLTPESSLKAALDDAPTVGYLWSSEVTGYSLHHALRFAGQDGNQRIILITDRRLGASNDSWKPVGAATNYEFSVIELRLNSKGEGEGKISLTGKVAVDSAAKAITLENYSALPVTLKNVRSK